uniref:Platelet-derived growth factor (PDGF) family profile domain-containing protein n=1 Tax=Pelusios castaneus TaxID=367368 RepID=A0A8C8RJI0_9SAUR
MNAIFQDAPNQDAILHPPPCPNDATFSRNIQLLLQASHPSFKTDQISLVNFRGEPALVLPFQEVWGRSFCRPLEMLVDIVSEYPSEVEHMFSPSCISLQRCTGCCGDETLQCVPVETANVTMQLLKMKPEGQVPYVELSFTEHRRCECRYGPPRRLLLHHPGKAWHPAAGKTPRACHPPP